MQDISVNIINYNEQMHIQRCIYSVKYIASDIFLVDSYSKDKTSELAEVL